MGRNENDPGEARPAGGHVARNDGPDVDSMLLRIAEERLGETTVVHVMGRLGGAGVEELNRACRVAGTPLEVDLSGLLHADEVGLALLRSLRDSGAELTGASPFIRLLLEGNS